MYSCETENTILDIFFGDSPNLIDKWLLFDSGCLKGMVQKPFSISSSFKRLTSPTNLQTEAYQHLLHILGKSDEDCLKDYGMDNLGNSEVYVGNPLAVSPGEVIEIAPWMFVDSDMLFILDIINNANVPRYYTAAAPKLDYTDTSFVRKP